MVRSSCDTLYMHMHYKQGILIPEQQVTDTNPLFDLATISRDLQATSTGSSSQTVIPHTHTALGKSTSNSSHVIVSSSLYFLDTISYNLTPIFILQFKNYAAKHRPSTQQISVNHYEFQSNTALYSLMMDSIRSETCRSDF